MSMEEAVLPTVREIERIAATEGFKDEDFAIFALPNFEARMPALKANITPKLKALGDAIAERWNQTQEPFLFAQVAQHLRRSVNPPVETWCAFSPEKRAYKPYVHYRVAISAEKVRVTVFVEDYAEEKESFARNLEANADRLAEYFGLHPFLLAYEITGEAGEPQFGHALDADTLRAFAARLQRVKGQHAIFGIQFAKSHQVVGSSAELVESALESMKKLKPIFALGTTAEIDIPKEVINI